MKKLQALKKTVIMGLVVSLVLGNIPTTVLHAQEVSGETTSAAEGGSVSDQTAEATPGTAETTPGTPETTPGTPETTPGTPETTPGTPETTPGTPETTPGTPETTPGTPETTPGTPETTPGTPNTTPGTPETKPETPAVTPAAPDQTVKPETDEQTPKKSEDAGKLLNYLFIESPVVQTPDTQYILASVGENTGTVTEATLTYQYNNGEALTWDMDKAKDGAILFSKEFQDESQNGEYVLKNLSYTIDGVKQTIDLAEVGIQSKFGVNQACETAPTAVLEENEVVKPSKGRSAAVTESTEPTEPTVGTTIMSLDESGNAVEVSPEELVQTFAESRAGERAASAKVVLAAGHDSTHTGARRGSLIEENLTLRIAQYCYDELVQYPGIEVYMSRTTEACPFGGAGISTGQCLGGHVNYAKSVNADYYVSFHLNASSAPSANGSEVYYPNANYRPDLGAAGEKLSALVAQELKKLGLTLRAGDGTIHADGDGTYPDGSPEDNFFVINQCKEAGIPAILIEHAFLSNAADAAKVLQTEAGLRSLGQADANAIIKYYGLVKGRWIQDATGWWFQYVNGSYPKNTWAYIGGSWYHFNTNGYRETGWITIGKSKYYLNAEGVMETGWKWIGKDWYCFKETGEMITGWYWDDAAKEWYLLNDNGTMKKGWFTSGSDTYYFFSNGAMARGTHKIDGVTYYFNSSGVRVSEKGWTQSNGKKYYIENGEKAKGWKTIDNARYYFDETTGAMVTGWRWVGSAWYYLKPDSGKMAQGWLTEGGKKYYLKSSGEMLKNWQWIKDAWYYLDYSSGAMATGWKWVGSAWYYLKPDSGKMAQGWLTEGGKKYYLRSSGEMLKNWQWIKDAWYYLDYSSGALHLDWKWIGSAWYYLEPETGKMARGWLTQSGQKYYLKSSGEMVTGVHTIDGVQYSFNYNGTLKSQVQNGWFEDSKGEYYLINGVKTTGWKWIGSSWYYFNSAGTMQKGWIFEGLQWYYLDNNGAMYRGWLNQDSKTYYLFNNGIMARGWHTLDNVQTYFNSSGELYSKGVTNIMGSTQTTVNQMVKYFKNSGAVYPSLKLAQGGAPTIETFCQFYMIEAQKEGVRPEVAFAQAMNETGFLKFGGIVEIEQFNFAGIGATDVNGKANSATFPNVQTGIRAQIQHLKAYASAEPLQQACCDPRFHLVKRGTAPYVEYLGIKENPSGTGWATARYYGITLVNGYMNKLLRS